MKADWVKPGAAVIDVGITRVLNEETGKTASAATSTPRSPRSRAACRRCPGGVGPMTRAMLLANVVEAAERACCAR